MTTTAGDSLGAVKGNHKGEHVHPLLGTASRSREVARDLQLTRSLWSMTMTAVLS